MRINARYVVTVDAPIIETGAVMIEEGRIAAVGPAGDFSGDPSVDYGDAVVCPGFVNAHTHLELTDLAGLVEPGEDFVDWLRRLMSLRATRPVTRESVHHAVDSGLRQSVQAGVTTIGDVTSTPSWTRERLARSALRSISFGEVIAIGKRRGLLAERLDAAASTELETPRMHIGISPHAPYTVEPDGMRACCKRAESMNAPLSIHLAESPDEARFTQSGAGPFADYLRTLEIWDEEIPSSGCDPVALVERAGILGSKTVIAHANYVDQRQMQRIAAGGSSIAFCPRTHHAFGHAPHRFVEMMANEINVCLGTDSLASNPSLSVLDEMRFLHRQHPQLACATILEMGTLCGARALGLQQEVGSLTTRKVADLVVIPLDSGSAADPLKTLLTGETQPSAVYIGGEAQSIDATNGS